jgi:copper resistance protein C
MIMRKNIHILTVSAFLCGTPTFAEAHAFLDHASPRVGNTVTPAPKEVVLWFTQQLEPAFSSIDVRNEQGATVTAGRATAGGDRTQLRVPLKALPPGTYKVIWRVLSVDTHRTDGSFTFRVGP